MDLKPDSPLIRFSTMLALLAVGCFLMALEWFLSDHREWFLGFYALFGFVSYLFVIGSAYLLRLLVSRPENDSSCDQEE